MSFLATDYVVESFASDFFKITEDATKIRILSASPSFGYEDRDLIEGKAQPVRTKEKNPPLNKVFKPNSKEFQQVKECWALKIWNYKDSRVQYWTFVQNTIKEKFVELSRNEEWNDPTMYDISILKSGKGIDTKYTLTPSAKGFGPLLDEDILKKIADTKFVIEAIFMGENPFTADEVF